MPGPMILKNSRNFVHGEQLACCFETVQPLSIILLRGRDACMAEQILVRVSFQAVGFLDP